ncbi:hypothetical protein [Actinomadura sp. NEAU-AAG7]|uniref:hypothetical protein n=1 Tax=Actinomadura sp. NEAU-AAG7 TaxID=2839640 RepID=UPI001BE49AF7|nr:hypothetical protein [Actinomadura sp. NEAU-AAG7]MBT2206597.1 hypothetical protein [Actinomadura sp. NEAU-AAG7]
MGFRTGSAVVVACALALTGCELGGAKDSEGKGKPAVTEAPATDGGELANRISAAFKKARAVHASGTWKDSGGGVSRIDIRMQGADRQVDAKVFELGRIEFVQVGEKAYLKSPAVWKLLENESKTKGLAARVGDRWGALNASGGQFVDKLVGLDALLVLAFGGMNPPGTVTTLGGRPARAIGFKDSPGKTMYMAASGDARPFALVDGKERLGFEYDVPVRIEEPRDVVFLPHMTGAASRPGAERGRGGVRAV